MTKTLSSLTALAFSLTVFATVASARPGEVDCTAAVSEAQSSIAAACPCDGASNHGEHVRCVTKKLRELSACTADASGKRSCGSVPRACVPKLRRLASRSACGKPADAVTCCVAKQRDCEGDSTPGDGVKEGTCTGTKRKCDSVTECMVPRCEVAASAERCTAIGGTLGTGRDCATACPQ